MPSEDNTVATMSGYTVHLDLGTGREQPAASHAVRDWFLRRVKVYLAVALASALIFTSYAAFVAYPEQSWKAVSFLVPVVAVLLSSIPQIIFARAARAKWERSKQFDSYEVHLPPNYGAHFQGYEPPKQRLATSNS